MSVIKPSIAPIPRFSNPLCTPPLSRYQSIPVLVWLTGSSSVFRPRDWTNAAVNQKVYVQTVRPTYTHTHTNTPTGLPWQRFDVFLFEIRFVHERLRNRGFEVNQINNWIGPSNLIGPPSSPSAFNVAVFIYRYRLKLIKSVIFVLFLIKYACNSDIRLIYRMSKKKVCSIQARITQSD